MPKVSVIIPVYNTEKFLPKCLDSVCNQTLSDIEIICINDCSLDGSAKIIEEYAKNDKRIKLIDLFENGGVSKARNIGIAMASGEFIGFMDSDDFIEADFYEKLYNKAVETGADCVKGNVYYYYPETGKQELSDFYDINSKVRQNKANFLYGFTSGIYKTDLVNRHEICFPEGITHFEDPYFSIKASIVMKNVQTVDNAKYFYLKHQDSSCSKCRTYEGTMAFANSVEAILELIKGFDISKQDTLIYLNFLIEQLIPWCSDPRLEEKSNIIAVNGLLKVLTFSKCAQKDILEYYFLNKRKIEMQKKPRIIAQLRKNLMNKGEKNA